MFASILNGSNMNYNATNYTHNVSVAYYQMMQFTANLIGNITLSTILLTNATFKNTVGYTGNSHNVGILAG